MSFFDLVRLSFTNLYQRKARTFLTILGVIIGTMSIVLMIALGEGSKQVFMEQVSQSTDLTKIEVYPTYTSGPSRDQGFTDSNVKEIEAIANVRTVLPITNVSLYLKNQRYAADLYLSAAPLDKLGFVLEKLDWGSLPKNKREVSIVLGQTMAMDSFKIRRGNKSTWELEPATDIDLQNEKFDVYFGGAWMYENEENLPDDMVLPKVITGRVTGEFGMTGGELDYKGYIDIDFVRSLIKSNKKFAEYIGLSSNYQNMYVYATDMDSVQGVLDEIKGLGYQAYSPMEYIKQMQEESERQQAQWGAVGAIALIVSAIGIINTMLTSIMERKREIGVLKVLGCPLLSILSMFLIEAAIIGLFGGLVGIGFSFGIQELVKVVPMEAGSFMGNMFGGNVRFIITPVLAALAIVGAALIGMVAGIYPAVRAMKLSPLSALRNE